MIRIPPFGRQRNYLLGGAVLLHLAGCDHARPPLANIPDDGALPAITDQSSSRAPQASGGVGLGAQASSGRPDATRILGTGVFVNNPGGRPDDRALAGSDGVTLNFANADIADVSKAVLGDILHLNYVVDGSVQGTLTLRTSQPIPRDAVLSVFESSLGSSGAALIRSGNGYRVVGSGDAARVGSIRIHNSRETTEIGYGLEVVPLNYISAREMLRLLGSISSNAAQVRADEARNILIVSGSSDERATILDSVRLFDVDYLSGMSFSVYHLHDASAASVSAELTQIFLGKGAALDGVVRFITIDRLNSILAVTSRPQYLDQVKAWIARLDQVGASDHRQLFVYYVQNGRARDLADVIGRLYGQSTEAGQRGPGAAGSSGAAGSQSAAGSPGGAFPDASGGAGGGFAPAAAGGGGTNPLLGPATSGEAGAAGQAGNEPRVTADEVNNAILVLGTTEQFRSLEQALLRLDVPPLQIMLEASIAEVDLNNELSFGVQYFFQDGHNQLSTTAASAVTSTSPGLAYSFVSGQNIKVMLDALASVTKVRVISAPKVLVLNNQAASLEVGDDVPITTQSAQSTASAGAPIVNSVQYRETGIIFNVTPRANQSGLVEMDISQEVSNVSTASASAASPTITQRKIRSTVDVQDGETVALGGLISDNRSNGENGIPYLSKIPYLGNLFSQRDDTVKRTELLVLITPHVVQSVDRLRVITRELRRHMGEVRQLLDR